MHDDLIAHTRRVLASYQPRELTFTDTRDAAVLVLLFGEPGAEHVILTKRTDRVEHHKGQISFPGGGRDPDDADLWATALREAWEEIGVAPDHVERLGALDHMRTISNFRVAPYVGRLTVAPPYPYVSSAFEVAEVIEAPLRHLLAPTTKVAEPRFTPEGRPLLGATGEPVTMPAYWWGEHRIWGATARMLEHFLALLSAPALDPTGKR